MERAEKLYSVDVKLDQISESVKSVTTGLAVLQNDHIHLVQSVKMNTQKIEGNSARLDGLEHNQLITNNILRWIGYGVGMISASIAGEFIKSFFT